MGLGKGLSFWFRWFRLQGSSMAKWFPRSAWFSGLCLQGWPPGVPLTAAHHFTIFSELTCGRLDFKDAACVATHLYKRLSGIQRTRLGLRLGTGHSLSPSVVVFLSKVGATAAGRLPAASSRSLSRRIQFGTRSYLISGAELKGAQCCFCFPRPVAVAGLSGSEAECEWIHSSVCRCGAGGDQSREVQGCLPECCPSAGALSDMHFSIGLLVSHAEQLFVVVIKFSGVTWLL